MTVLVNQSSKRFHGTGSVGPLTWTWRFLANTDILVYRIAEPNEDDPTTEVRELLGGGDYILTGAGSYNGGRLTLASPLLDGEDLIIERRTEALQKVSIRNQGNNFLPATHEDVFDRLTMMIQDRERQIDTNTEDITGLKARMTVAEATLVAHGSRLDDAEDTILTNSTNIGIHANALSDHEGRIAAAEVSVADHEGRISLAEDAISQLQSDLAATNTHLDQVEILAGDSVIVYDAPGSPEVMVYADATAGNINISIVAADDGAAKTTTVIKTDGTDNVVTVTPAGGTVMGLGAVDIVVQDEAVRLVPRSTNNNWYRS